MHETFHNAMKFANNFRHRHPEHGLSNVYVLRRIKDGNVLEELYGMNVMTQYGIQRFIDDEIDFPTNVYIGRGNPTQTSLGSKVSDVAATVRDDTIDYELPVIFGRNTSEYGYSSDNQIITVSCKYLTAYFPASFDNLTEDVSITEYGLGESVDQMWTLSKVYTQYGGNAVLVKHPGEELEITVYLCMQIRGYGNYAGNIGDKIVTTMHWFFNRMVGTLKTTKGNSATLRNATSVVSLSGWGNTSDGEIDTFTLEKNTSDANGYVDGFIYSHTGFLYATRSTQSKALSMLTTPNKNHIFDDQYLSTRYHEEFLPMYDITNLSTKSFSPETGTYSVAVNDYRIQNANVYSNLLMKKEYGVPLYVEENGVMKTYYVYLNLNYSIADITSMNPNISVLYGTDFYWYRPYWIQVSNPSSIEDASLHPSGSSATISRLRACKYWITDTNTLDLQPNIEPTSTGATTTGGSSVRKTDATFPQGVCAYAADYYAMIGNQVYVNQNQYTANNVVGDVSNTFIYSVDIGRYMVFTRANTTQFMRIDAASSGLTYRQLPYRSDSGAVDLFNSFMTFNDNGGCMSIVYGTHDFIFLHLRAPDQSSQYDRIYDDGTTLTACAIQNNGHSQSLGSNLRLFAHISTAADHTVNIYQWLVGTTAVNGVLSTLTPYKSFTIPSSAATPVWMFGFSKFVYVSDGATYMYVIDIINETVTLCDGFIPWSASDIIKTRTTGNVDGSGTISCFVLYQYDDTNMAHAYVLSSTNPTHLTTLASLDSGVTGKGSACIYKLLNRGQSIYLICNFETTDGTQVINEVYDFGHWLYDGTVDVCTLSNITDTMILLDFASTASAVSYKTTAVYPDRFVKKELSGTTGIITTIDGPKDVAGAKATITFELNGGWPPSI